VVDNLNYDMLSDCCQKT